MPLHSLHCVAHREQDQGGRSVAAGVGHAGAGIHEMAMLRESSAFGQLDFDAPARIGPNVQKQHPPARSSRVLTAMSSDSYPSEGLHLSG